MSALTFPGGGRMRTAGRLWGPVTLAGLLVAAWSVARDAGRWRGDWWWGYDHLTQAFPILLVLVAMAVAWDAGSADNGIRSWNARVPDARWKVPASTAGRTLLLTVVVQLLATVVVLGFTVANSGAVDPRALLGITSPPAMLVLAAAIGLAVGSVLASIYAAICAAGVMTLLLFVAPPGGVKVIEFPGTGSSVIGYQPSSAYFLGLVAGLLATSGALWALAVLAPRSPGRIAAGAALAVLPLLATSALLPEHQFIPGDQAPDRCVSGTVAVCVFPGYDALLRPFARDLDAFVTEAGRRGVDTSRLPRRVVQYAGGALPPGTGVLSLVTGSTTSPPTPDNLAEAVSTPLWCRAMFAPSPPERLLQDRQLVYDWALVVQGAMPVPAFTERHPGLPGKGPEVAAAVDAALTRMTACDR